MRTLANCLIALRALTRNRLRSALTALGIIIGVGAVIAMVSVGNGARALVEAQVASLGENILIVYPGSNQVGGVRGGWGTSSTLTLADAEAIAREIPGVVAVSPEVMRPRQLSAGNQNWFALVQGQGSDYFRIRRWGTVSGELFHEGHVRSGAQVCVIGQTIARQLFGSDDPVGRTIRIRGMPATVLGVLQSKGFGFGGQDQDNVVVVPITMMQRRVTGNRFLGAIHVQATDASKLGLVRQQVAALLRERKQTADSREDPFTIRGLEEISAAATQTSRTMTLLLGSIAAVSLLVGGIGIMNIMLVSVTERTREIGLRLAVGARQRDIRLQFVVEALLLATLGGVLGVLGGIATATAIARGLGWPTLVSAEAIVSALLVSAAVGIFFGWYPAGKAARLNPIDALRHE